MGGDDEAFLRKLQRAGGKQEHIGSAVTVWPNVDFDEPVKPTCSKPMVTLIYPTHAQRQEG